MTVERVFVTALPRSARAADSVQVSAFLTPKLTPDAGAADAVLGDFAVFPTWAAAVAGGRVGVRLLDQDGPIEATADLSAVDPTLWAALFPADTPVRANAVPDWSDRTHASFGVATAAAAAKAVQWMTAVASPGDTPAPDAHPFAPFFEKLIERFQLPDGHDRRPDARRFDEVGFRDALDRLAGRGGSLSHGMTGITGSDADAAARVAAFSLLAFHQARRFYDRPEAETVTHGEPVPSATPPEHVQPRGPEFHERVTAAGDHPELLRRLGLLIDLTADTSRLARSQWIAVELDVDQAGPIARTLRTAVGATADGSLVATGAPQASSDSVAGVVPLGDPQRFTVVDVDADGSALKMDRFLGNFPRLLALQRNGDDVTAASPALRAQGLAVARTGRSDRAHARVDAQRALEAQLDAPLPAPQSPLLHADDLVRGVRIEVWDRKAAHWRSLHERRSQLVVEGFGEVYRDLRNEGYLQGTPAQETPGVQRSPIYVHETLFGWEGWSLSAPRPGKRLRPVDSADPSSPTGWRQDEVPEDTPTTPLAGEAPPDPLRFSHEIEPGSLPRLRYGREYAFRAWSVDLGGYSRAHSLSPAPAPQLLQALTADDSILAHVRRQRTDAATRGETPLAGDALPTVKAAIAASRERLMRSRADIPAGALSASESSESSEIDPAARIAGLAGHIALRRGLRDSALRATAAGAASLAAEPAELGVRGLWAELEARQDLPDLATASLDRSAVAEVVASTLVTLGLGDGAGGAAAVAEAQSAVTALQPFLRWDPVPPPAIVPRRRFTEGESLRTVVIRSGVRYPDADSGPEFTDPATYAAQLLAADAPGAGYAEFGERHLVPPKTTHDHAELHGAFDDALDAVGADRDAARSLVIGWSLRDEGTLYDAFVVNPSDPFGPRIPQDVALLHDPGAENGPLKSLPLAMGEGPASGQYLAITSATAVVPYLPDPLAEGVSLRFMDAGVTRALWFGHPREGFTARYAGSWPEREPYLLRLGAGDVLSTRIDGHVLGIDVPAGESLRMRMSSSIVRDELDTLGPWRLLAAAGENPLLREEAVDGRLWTVSPSEAVVLVHATPRPVERPRLVDVPAVLRAPGSTEAHLAAGVDLHGPSTESLTGELAWSEPVDDPGLGVPFRRSQSQIGFTTPIAPWEDTAVLLTVDTAVPVAELGLVGVHATRQVFPDTKHREVTYRLRATTRHREYFPPAALAPDGEGDDGVSVVSAPFTLHVPSSAAPPAPVVHSVLPLFRWSRTSEPNQPAAWRHTRASGVRVYLERPWHATGDDELLAVLLAPDGADGAVDGDPYYSQWGADPIWPTGGVEKRMIAPIQLDHVLRIADLDDRERPGRPVTEPTALPIGLGRSAALAHKGTTVLGYRPQYSAERDMWFVDIAFDTDAALWPFVRLSLARYQPHSVDGMHLSEAVRADFVQLPPPRLTSVSRTDERHVKVLVSGPVAYRADGVAGVPDAEPGAGSWMIGGASVATAPGLAGRLMVARLQERVPELGDDLGWRTVATQELVPLGGSFAPPGLTFGAELDAGEDVDLRRPEPASGATRWRVTVEEWERFPGDPAPPFLPGIAGEPVWEQRLVYADEVHL